MLKLQGNLNFVGIPNFQIYKMPLYPDYYLLMLLILNFEFLGCGEPHNIVAYSFDKSKALLSFLRF